VDHLDISPLQIQKLVFRRNGHAMACIQGALTPPAPPQINNEPTYEKAKNGKHRDAPYDAAIIHFFLQGSCDDCNSNQEKCKPSFHHTPPTA